MLSAFGVEVLVVAAVVGAGLIAVGAAGGYRPRVSHSSLDDLPGVVGGTSGGGALGWCLATVVLGEGNARLDATFLIALASWPITATILRCVGYGARRRYRRRRPLPTVLVGAGQVAARVTDTLSRHPELGMKVIGVVGSGTWTPTPGEPEKPVEAPPLGLLDELPHIVRSHRVERVIITFSSMRESEVVETLRQCDELDCEIYLVPRLFELSQSEGSDHVWGIPLHRLRRPAFRSPSRHVKRAVDVVVAAGLLVLVSPVLAVLLGLARLETGGWFFGQERLGRGGVPFRVLKIQSMRPEDDQESRTRWNIAADHRVGPVGRFIRRTSLDELPQLWNVLRGDMSLVGPRPERPYFVRQFSATMPHYSARNRVRAGLTGWAQIHDLRGDTSVSERAVFDNYYIEHWSLWGDVKIGLRTVGAVVRGAGG